VERLRQDPNLLAEALALFEKLVEEPAEDREAALSDLTSSDSGLAGAVRWLLEQDRRAGAFLAGQPDVIPGEAAQRWIGRRISSYVVRSVLGEGGMSHVFRGEDGDGRPVAIKILRRGVAAPEVERRFDRERAILESLDDPRIARLQEAGTTADGFRYLVMEYVDGVPITEYCDTRRLGIRERLRLFRTVCEAVHQAHLQLVAHRDLKPANILVTERGEAKLLDFGIAKLLDSDEVTATQARLLTPGYASPEQLLGGRITVATDVYSLGVLLCELSCGMRPTEAGWRLPAELADDLRVRDPTVPSRALLESLDATTRESVAAERGTDATTLARQLSGDVDAIVAKALRYRPAERYGSALEMADDLGRHLSGRPVLARRSTLAYRARKFLRRHPVAVALTALGVTALGVASTFQVVESMRVREERDRYRQVLAYLTDSYDLLSPGKGSGPGVTARELLDSSAARLEEDLGDEPEARAAVTHSIGKVYFDLGLYETSVELLEEALELRRRTFGRDSLEVADTLHTLLVAATRLGELERAEGAAREALETRRRHLPDSSPLVAASRHSLAKVLVQTGEYERAIELVQQALTVHRTTPGAEPEVASDLVVLSEALIGRGDFESARSVAAEAVEANLSIHGERHSEFVAAVDRLADALFHLGRLAEAEPWSRRAYQLYSELLGEQHPDTARAANELALVLWQQGKLAEAEDFFRRALSLTDAALGPDHPDLATMQQNLGLVLRSRGAYAEAEEAMRGALERYRRLYPGGHRNVALALNNIASVRSELGDESGAIELYRQALDMFRSTGGERHPDVAMVLNNLGGLELRAARYDAAEEDYRRALDIVTEAAGTESLYVAILWNNLGKVAFWRGDVSRAEELERRALELLRRIDGDEPSSRQATVLYDLGETELRKGELQGARERFTAALETRRRLLGDDHPDTQLARLGLLEVSLERTPESAVRMEAECLDVLRRLRTQLPPNHLDVAPAILLRARIDLALGRADEARASAQQALAVLRRHLADQHPQVEEALRVVAASQ